MFDKEKICAGRENTKEENYNCFHYFLKHFGPCVAGKKKYSEKIMGQKLFSDIATVSDEAFVYFTIERCWNSWESAMSNIEQGKKTKVKAMYSEAKANKKYKGWTKEGLLRFDDLCKQVKIDRELNNKEGELLFMNNVRQTQIVKLKEPNNVMENKIEVYNDLSDSTEDIDNMYENDVDKDIEDKSKDNLDKHSNQVTNDYEEESEESSSKSDLLNLDDEYDNDSDDDECYGQKT